MTDVKAGSCVFCDKIAEGTVDRTIASDVVFFRPLNPVTPGHRLFVPTTHLIDAGQNPAITGRVFAAAARHAQQRSDAFNLITSAGSEATQTIRHLHVHYVPRHAGDGLPLPWTPQHAAALRGETQEGR